MDASEVFRVLERSRDAMVQTLTDLCRIPAIGPAAGGEGETEKAKRIEALLKDLGLKGERLGAPDHRGRAGRRPPRGRSSRGGGSPRGPWACASSPTRRRGARRACGT